MSGSCNAVDPTLRNTENLDADSVAGASVDEVLRWLDTSASGLSSAEAARRLTTHGPNAVRTHRVSALAVLGRQLRSALLVLLAATATLSFFLGDSTQAIIIGVILLASVGLGFANEYRAERAAADLHSTLRHTTRVRRDGTFRKVDVSELVRGDVVRLALGEVVPADLRLLEVSSLECDESILTGESSAAEKRCEPTEHGAALADLTDLAFMGTVVSAGDGCGVVYATGSDAQFGQIAAGLERVNPRRPSRSGCADSPTSCCGWRSS